MKKISPGFCALTVASRLTPQGTSLAVLGTGEAALGAGRKY